MSDLTRAAEARAAASRASPAEVADAVAWLHGWRQEMRVAVERVRFDEMERWVTDRDGNLVHDSGRFFRVEGLRVDGARWSRSSWCQPIINQPEVGVLGFLLRVVDDRSELLAQAKAEPGNVHGVQLAPTVQATRSNFTRVHRGLATRYLDRFLSPRPGTVLADSIQSEQGSRFLAKHNRNMVVRVDRDVPVHNGFRWLPVDVVVALLGIDNLVNMDARSVLATMPDVGPPGEGSGRSLHSDNEIAEKLVDLRARCTMRAEPIALGRTEGWSRTPAEIFDTHRRFFRVIAVAVETSHREVRSWFQPMLSPWHCGLAAFAVRTFEGEPHVLAQARAEPGFRQRVEIGPTLQCVPYVCRQLPAEERPPLYNEVIEALGLPASRSVVLSEEGGRFHHQQNSYALVDATDIIDDEPDRFFWISVSQLRRFVRMRNRVSVEGRTLLACLGAFPPALSR